MHLKPDDSFSPRSVMLMLGSVALFAVNTLLIRAVAQHTPAAGGWVATFFRGGIGLLVVFGVYGWGRGLDPKRLFTGRLIAIRGIVGAFSIVAYQFMSVSRGSSLQMLLPLATALGGYQFFGETFRPLEIAGAALTLIATWRVVSSRA